MQSLTDVSNGSWCDSKMRTEILKIVEESALRRGDTAELRTIYLFLTRKCNLGCSHCYINGVGKQARDKDFDLLTIERIITEARTLGLRKVKVSGGEPLLHPEAKEILAFLAGIGLKEVVLETNGTVLPDTMIDFLAPMENLTVFVSLDHYDPNEHDAFRKRHGAWAKASNTIRKLAEANIKTVVTTTAYRENVGTILNIIEMVLDWGVFRHRTLLNIHPLGNAKENLSNAVTLAECKEVIDAIISSDHYASGRAYLTLPPALTPIRDIKEVYTCGWGDGVLGVLSTGDVSMCSASYDDASLLTGNIQEQSLTEIWQDGGLFKELREVGKGRVQGVCSNCIFYSACRGVCKMSSYAHYKQLDAPYPLCQEFYNHGWFPKYALIDPERDCSYKPDSIPFTRLVQLNRSSK